MVAGGHTAVTAPEGASPHGTAPGGLCTGVRMHAHGVPQAHMGVCTPKGVHTMSITESVHPWWDAHMYMSERDSPHAPIGAGQGDCRSRSSPWPFMCIITLCDDALCVPYGAVGALLTPGC